MSEFEANLPGLELHEAGSTPKKAAKKATRKVAAKKAARKTAKAATPADAGAAPAKTATKKAARKTAKAAGSDPAEADKAERTAKATTASEAPARTAKVAESENRPTKAAGSDALRRDSASRADDNGQEREGRDTGSAKDRGRYGSKPARPARDGGSDDVPMHFSASPDDMDEYGDIRERNRRASAEAEKPRDQADGGDRPSARKPEDGTDSGQRQRDDAPQQGGGQQRPQRDYRERHNGGYAQNKGNGDRQYGNDRQGNGNDRQGNGNDRQGNGDRQQGNADRHNNGDRQGNERQGGYGQPFAKKGHFQKNSSNNPQGGQQGGGKFQKFKKGDKFNPNAPQQGGGHPAAHQGKKAKLAKVRPGRKGSWQSQFAAASEEDTQPPVFDGLLDWDLFRSPQQLEARIAEITSATASATAAANAEALATAAAAQGAGGTTLAGESLSGNAFAAKTPSPQAVTDGDSDGSGAASAPTAADSGQPAEAGTASDDTAADSSDTAAKSSAPAVKSGEAIADDATAKAAASATSAHAGAATPGAPFNYHEAYALKLPELEALAKANGIRWEGAPQRRKLLESLLATAAEQKRPILVKGLVELLEDGFGFVVFGEDNYRLRNDSPFIAAPLIQRYGLQRGHEIEALLHPAREGETTPFVLRVDTIMGKSPEAIQHLTPFKELTPYYPTERILLESEQGALGKWDNISMRIVDLLSPVGLGQRGLIVAPPRTGKTVLMQGIANAIRVNRPEARLIILLVDERPEEVTDFRRSVKGAQVVSSTFDEAAESHVHAAEMVIEKARRLVEIGEDVIILLDSITRLARAYNTTMPSSGKILSGGVEAGALQKPKRFFGSARNIEGGGSLTILGTALVETGSKMDEVIFEEFKGTGNMELHLDRDLSNKRVFPALSFEKSGTRKEELLYHPDEMEKVHALRRAMKGVPSTEAMEMLIQRVKRSKTNAQFLMSMAR